MKHTDHGLFVDAENTGVFQGGRGRRTNRLSGEAGFSKKSSPLQNRDDGFFALLRDHGQLDLARLDIEHGIRRIPLRKENLLLGGRQTRFVVHGFTEECLAIERRAFVYHHSPSSTVQSNGTSPAGDTEGDFIIPRGVGHAPRSHPDGSCPLPSPHHSLLDEGNTLSTSVQGIGSARRRDGSLQAIHSLLHFSQCQTDLFDGAMAQGMDTVPHPQPKAFFRR